LLEYTARMSDVERKAMAETVVAFFKKSVALVPRIVWVELEPNISLSPPPLPACKRIDRIRRSEAITWIVISAIYILNSSFH